MMQAGLFGTAEPPQAARIRAGHIKMWERWTLMKGMPDGTGRDKMLKIWDEAWDRLEALCAELVGMGFTDCLYKDEDPRFACLQCPKKTVREEDCKAWKIEL